MAKRSQVGELIEESLHGDWLGVHTETDDRLLQMAAVNMLKPNHYLTQFSGVAIWTICVMFAH